MSYRHNFLVFFVLFFFFARGDIKVGAGRASIACICLTGTGAFSQTVHTHNISQSSFSLDCFFTIDSNRNEIGIAEFEQIIVEDVLGTLDCPINFCVLYLCKKSVTNIPIA